LAIAWLRDLSSLEAPFSQEEIKDTIHSMPGTKHQGQMDSLGGVFKACWKIIKDDLIAAFNHLFPLNSQGFNLLNSANIILLPKKLDGLRITNYMPISLIHSIIKIFSKLLANRLALLLDSMVSKCQSAFIKRRSIHNSFLYVQNTVRRLHKMKRPTLFMKLDIQKAFDTINWCYMLEMLQVMGFGPRWREWVSILFQTASSRAILNGQQGPSFGHSRGVRQGNPYRRCSSS
jgi:mannosylglycoprotein endo-beta-mannosidase